MWADVMGVVDKTLLYRSGRGRVYDTVRFSVFTIERID